MDYSRSRLPRKVQMPAQLIFTPKVVGDEKPLLWWPGQPNTYGKNPHGKPLYRVIWSESRTWMIGGAWPDGTIEYRWVPYYGGRKEWVLEKWLSPVEFAGTKETWDRDTLDYELCARGIVIHTMGDYPTRGWYEHCYSFPTDSEPNIEAIAPILESCKNISLAQIKAGLRLWHERQRKDWENKVEAGILDAMPAFHGVASNVAPSKPTADHWSPEDVKKFRGQEQTVSAEEFAQPNPRGFSIGQRKG